MADSAIGGKAASGAKRNQQDHSSKTNSMESNAGPRRVDNRLRRWRQRRAIDEKLLDGRRVAQHVGADLDAANEVRRAVNVGEHRGERVHVLKLGREPRAHHVVALR